MNAQDPRTADVDWDRYRRCPVCGSDIGDPCASMTVGMVTEATRIVPRDEPHSRRNLRAGVGSA